MKFTKLLLFIICLPAIAFAQKDTLVFKNGTIVIGEAIKIQLGVITFDPDDANDITVQLRKLKSIHAGNRDFRVETVDHQVLIGRIQHSERDAYVNVIHGSDTVNLALSNISNLYPVEKSFRKRLNGSAGAGYSYTRSSQLGRLNLDFSARYLTRKVEYTAFVSTIATVDSSSLSRENEDAGLGINYYFHERWYTGFMFNYQRNIEIGIKSRLQEGAGIGNKLLLTRYVRLLAFSGFVFNQEVSTEDVRSGVLPEGMLGFQFNVFRFEKPELDIQTTQYGYTSLNEKRFRYAGDLSITWEMIEDIDLKLSFYADYDSKPPGTETANTDYGTVISIAFEF